MIKILLFALFILSGSANAGFWQDQATAFREHGDKLGSDKFPDYNKAYHFYCVSTAMRDNQAAFAIGTLYLKGHGVGSDPAIAKGWFEYAAKLGNLESTKILRDYQDIASKEDSFCLKHDPGKTLNKNDIMAWVNLIAPTFGLDPMMVNAVIKVESGFNPKAISNRNAQGLMQLIPSTAQRFGVQDSFDPVQNLFGGIAYLRYLLQMFSGDLAKAWAAYNAGEAAVIRNKGVPPFAETIQYVRMLLAMYPRTSSPINAELPFVFADKNTL
ncbi:MAG: transglycosylase SLT domain-containing protein [Methylococcales bacterium]